MDFIGDKIITPYRGIISPDKVIEGEYQSIIGNGAGLFSSAIALFSNATFVNTTPRMLSYGTAQPSVTSFAANVLATRVINGHKFAQIETAKTNGFTRNQQLEHADWTKTRAAVTPNAAVAPNGETTMDTLVEDSTAGSTHYLTQSFTPNGSSDYVFSFYAKTAGRLIKATIAADGFSSAVEGWFNLTTGATGTSVGSPLSFNIKPCGNGVYRCWISKNSDAAAATDISLYLANADNSDTYDGDGSSGVHIWGPQIEIGRHPSSPILSEASVTTRNKDVLYWASADVPAALRGPFKFQWIPRDDHDMVNSVYLWVFKNLDASPIVYLWYNAATNRFRLYQTSGSQSSDVVTFIPDQPITFDVNPIIGTIAITGCLSGNSTITHTPWATTAGNVYWGLWWELAAQMNSLISEPY